MKIKRFIVLYFDFCGHLCNIFHVQEGDNKDEDAQNAVKKNKENSDSEEEEQNNEQKEKGVSNKKKKVCMFLVLR